MLGATGRVEVIGQAGDAAEALAALARVTVDVVFLDIHMPGMSGLEMARRLPAALCVVFTTAYDQHALEAFEASAIDYLLKPVERPRLARALDRVERLRAEPARGDLAAMLERLAATLGAAPSAYLKRIPFRTRDGVQFLDVAAITHFTTRDRLTHAVTAASDHVVDQGLADLESKLDPAKFIRIHRGTLLNLDHLDEIQPWPGGRLLVRVKDPKRTELEVARDRVQALKERLGL
ncbi:MAG TPA: LytTR family DNA-binding domain-containing protein [Candidatus Acidoferrum sp.]|nr:LytTR family DNA-binding domain-containing protein [Candidatus Acidoferrum sp.]